MQDRIKENQNCFIVYSAATGKYDAELAAGITPYIRQTCRVNALTPFTSVSGSFSKDGLIIKPEINGNTCSFTIKITACNFFVSDKFSVTFKTQGLKEENQEGELVEIIQPTTKTITFYVLCYGEDRVYLKNHFREYNCKKDKVAGRQHINLSSVNGLTGIGFHQTNLPPDNSILIYDRDVDDRGNSCYYTWTAGKIGCWGIAVEGQTYQGGANVAGFTPNPFNAGFGADVLLIGNYPDYVNKDDLCLTISNQNFTPYIFALYSGVMQDNGGGFTPVYKSDGKIEKLTLYIEQKDGNTVYHTDFQVIPDASTWQLKKREYIDNNAASWEMLATAPNDRFQFDVQIDGVKKTLSGVVSLPFQGWSDTALEVIGDCKYFVSGYGYFNSITISSPEGEFQDFIIYSGNKGYLYNKQEQQIKIGDELKTMILFPDADAWTIEKDGKKTKLENSPVTCSEIAIPYAPPIKDDFAFNTGISKGDASIDMALNPNTSDLSICLGEAGGGIWKRYPLQRMITEPVSVNVKMKSAKDGNYSHRYIQSSKYQGEQMGYIWDDIGANTTIYRSKGGEQIEKTHFPSKKSGVESQVKNLQLDAVIRDAEKPLSFCGMKINPPLECEYTGQNYLYTDTILREGSHTDRYFENIDEDVEVPHGWIPKSRGKQILVQESYIDEQPEQIIEITEYTEQDKSNKSGVGFVDCYLHTGQANTDNGRKVALAASAVASIKTDPLKVNCKKTHSKSVNGEYQFNDVENTEKEVVFDLKVARAEAFARISNPNQVSSCPEPDRTSDKDYNINISVSMSNPFTGANYTWDFENKQVGSASKKISWQDDDGDEHSNTYTYPCFVTVGESSRTVKDYLTSVYGNASFSKTGNAASCQVRIGSSRDYKREYYYYYSQQAAERDNEEYPYFAKTTRYRTRKETYLWNGGKSIKITHLGDGLYKVVRKIGIQLKVVYQWDSRTGGGYTEKTAILDGQVYDYDDGFPDDITYQEQKKMSVADVRRIFDQWCAMMPQEGEEPEDFAASEQFQYGEYYADFTDAPFDPTSTQKTYSYTQNSTEQKPAEISLSFKQQA